MSQNAKQHLDRSSVFFRAHTRDQKIHRQTHVAISIATWLNIGFECNISLVFQLKDTKNHSHAVDYKACG